MPAKAVKKPEALCPMCLLDADIRTPLNENGFIFTCKRGHRFEDREELSVLMMQAREKLKAQENPEPEPPAEEPDGIDRSVVDKKQRVVSGNGGISISPVDFARISSVIGHFTDSSSLFGGISALNDQLTETKELLERAEAAKAVGGVKKIKGDVAFQAVVPERWVQAIHDIAEANGMSLERYMNSMISKGIDEGWYC